MADTVTLKIGDILITGVPSDNRESAKAQYEWLRDNKGPGEYAYVPNFTPPSPSQSQSPPMILAPPVRSSLPMGPQQPVDAVAGIPTHSLTTTPTPVIAGPPVPPGFQPPAQQQAQQPDQEPRFDLAGALGGVVRGAGPVALGTLGGGVLGSVVPGVGTVAGASLGAISAVAAKFIGDPLIRQINKWFGTDYAEPTQALNDLFNRLGVAQPDVAAERIIQIAAEGMAEGIATVGLGNVIMNTQAVPMSSGARAFIGNMLAEAPAAEVIGSTTAGAASQTAAEAGGGPVAQMAAGMAGGILGGIGGNVITKPGVSPSVIDDATRAGITVTTSDVRRPSTFAGRWLQNFGERFPVVGTGSLRRQQQAQRVAALRNLLSNYGADDVAGLSDDIIENLFSTRSKKWTHWADRKQVVIDAMNDVAYNDIMQVGEDGLTTIMGPRILDTTATRDLVDLHIADLKSLNTTDVNPLIGALERFSKSIESQPMGNVDILRQQLGETLESSSLATNRTLAGKISADIYDALRADMTSHVIAQGDDALTTLWVTANKNLAKMAEEAKVPSLRRVLKNGEDTPEIINNLIFNAPRSGIERLFRELDPTGQAKVRTAIIARAAERAGGEALDPDRFVREVKRLGDQVGVFFDQDAQNSLEGLMRVFELTTRAQNTAIAGGISQTLVPLAAAGLGTYFGGGIKGFLATAAGGTGVGMLTRIYETPAVRNILMRIPKLARGSAQEDQALRTLAQAIRAVVNTEEPPEGERIFEGRTRNEEQRTSDAELIRG